MYNILYQYQNMSKIISVFICNISTEIQYHISLNFKHISKKCCTSDDVTFELRDLMLNVNINKYVRPSNTRVACCPLVSHVEYTRPALLSLENKMRQTDGRIPDRYIMLTTRRNQRNK